MESGHHNSRQGRQDEPRRCRERDAREAHARLREAQWSAGRRRDSDGGVDRTRQAATRRRPRIAGRPAPSKSNMREEPQFRGASRTSLLLGDVERRCGGHVPPSLWISTHAPVRGATMSSCVPVSSSEFQPTPPVRGATRKLEARPVSVHMPLPSCCVKERHRASPTHSLHMPIQATAQTEMTGVRRP